MTAQTPTDLTLANALHAAETWLERIGAAQTDVALVTIHPRAAVSVWRPGWPKVVTLLDKIDDAGAELCEAVAPAVQQGLEQLKPRVRELIADVTEAGARLQALLIPSAGEFSLRLLHDGRSIVLCSAELQGELH